jgi:transcriptional regulator with XRE-family HTH domain
MEKMDQKNLGELLKMAGGDLVGARVRRIRERQGLSLRELAERAEISKNTLLRLEQGMVPRLSTLRQVARALRVKPRLLCTLDLVESPVISILKNEDLRWFDMDNYRGAQYPLADRVLDESERRQFAMDGATPFSNLTNSTEVEFFHPNLIELYKATPRRSHPGMEFCFVLSGTIRIVFENEVRMLEAGESINFHATEVHHYEVVGEVIPARVLSIVVYFGEGVKDKVSHWGWVQKGSE